MDGPLLRTGGETSRRWRDKLLPSPLFIKKAHPKMDGPLLRTGGETSRR